MNILRFLDDESLTNICKLNSYARELCSEDELWINRIRDSFGQSALSYKPLDQTYRDFYWDLQHYSEENFVGHVMKKYPRDYDREISDYNWRIIYDLLIDEKYNILQWMIDRGKVDITDPDLELNEPLANSKNAVNLQGLKLVIEDTDLDFSFLSNVASGNSKVDVLEYLEEMGVLDVEEALLSAVQSGSNKSIDWILERYDEPIQQEWVDAAAEYGKLNTLIKLEKEYGRLPSRDGADAALFREEQGRIKGTTEVLKWLSQRGIYPHD